MMAACHTHQDVVLSEQRTATASRRQVVLPVLKRAVRAAARGDTGGGGGDEDGGGGGDGDDDEEIDDRPLTFFYQRPPTVRLQPPSGAAEARGGREHCDAEYGHQDGELNFWLPLTDPARTRTSLWAESAPSAGDFHPLDVAQGEIARFHGTRCRHRAPPNASACTRVSLDFRVGIGGFFDPLWQLKEAKAQHTRREVTI